MDEKGDEVFNITSTPDWYEVEQDKDNNLNFKVVGDIKCTKQANDGEIMTERYYFQILHNCYVLNCFSGEINAKNGITEDIYNWCYQFTEQDFKEYEKKLIEFYTAWKNKDIGYYDNFYYDKKKKEEVLNITLEQKSAEFNELNHLMELKNQLVGLENQIKEIEEKYKASYVNANLITDKYTFSISSLERKGAIDYKKYFYDVSQKFKVPVGFEKEYRKPSTFYKLLKIKENKQGE